MDVHQSSRLHDWLAQGKQSGQIRESRTVILAYCMDGHAVLPLIRNVVEGRMTEEDALSFMERVIYFGTLFNYMERLVLTNGFMDKVWSRLGRRSGMGHIDKYLLNLKTLAESRAAEAAQRAAV